MPEETLYTEDEIRKEEFAAGEAVREKETGEEGKAGTDNKMTEEEDGKNEPEAGEAAKVEDGIEEAGENEPEAEEAVKEEAEAEESAKEKREIEEKSGKNKPEAEESAKEKQEIEEKSGKNKLESEEPAKEKPEIEEKAGKNGSEIKEIVKEESGIAGTGENTVIMEEVYSEERNIGEIIDEGEGEERMAEQDWHVSEDEERPELEFAEEEPRKRGFFRRNREEAHFLRDKWILSRIRDEDLMEYLILEQKRNEQLQRAKDIREKRIISAFKLSVSLAAGVAVVYLLKDNPTIFVNILYIGGILGGFWFWKNSHEK